MGPADCLVPTAAGDAMLRRALNPRATLRSLSHAGFRWFMVSRLAGSPTVQMRAVAQGWLIYSMTGSALALGWVSGARALVMLLVSPLGGVICDRFEKRKVMAAGRLILGLSAMALAILFYTGRLQPIHIGILAMVEGVAFSIVGPAMTSIVAELVDRDILLNAVSVSAIVHSGMQIVGSLLAGWMIEALGAGGVYASITVLMAVASFALVQLPSGVCGDGRGGGIYAELRAGLGYVASNPVLIAVLGLAFARVLLAQPYRGLLPAYAQDNLHVGASGLGLLTSATGIGALAMAILSATIGDTPHKGKLLLASGIGIGAALLVLMTSRSLPVAFALILVESSFTSLGQMMTSTLQQSYCQPEYRGRLAGVSMMLMGLSSLILIPAGALVDKVGVPTVVSAMGALIIVVYVVVALLLPRVRGLA
jgi:MFS family permease